MLHLYPTRRFLPLLIPTYPPEEGGGPTPPIPTFGLSLWLKGDAGVTQAAGFVSNWADQSGNGNDASQATGGLQPTFNPTSINGLPGLTFDGVASTMAGAFAPGSTGISVIYVAKSGASLSSFGSILNSQGGAGTTGIQWGFALGSDGSFGAGYGGPDESVSFGGITGVATESPFSASFVYDKVTWQMNGAASGSASDTSFPSGPFTYALGHDTGAPANSWFKGDIAEIIVYDHPLSAPDLATVQAYINTKYFPTPEIPTLGLTAWLKGDDIPGSDGDAIATWPDASGNHFDAAQATPGLQPVLKKGVNGINGHAAAQVVAPTGTADSYLQGTIDFGGSTTTTGMTAIYVVHTSPTPTFNPQPIYATVASLGDGGFDLFGCGSDVSFGAGWSDGGFNFGDGVTDGLAANQGRYGIFVFDPAGTWTCYGVNSGTSPGDPAFTSGNFRIGYADYGGSQFDGLIAEVIYYNRALTPTEIATVQAYISTKYGIS